MINKKVIFKDLGLIDYRSAWDYQTELFNVSVNNKIENRNRDIQNQIVNENYLIFCEHPHVYTLGKSGKREHLLINDSELQEKEANYYEINRGGDITYHGPGQLVCYPILDLDYFFTDIHKYMRLLEQAVINTLGHFGISAGRIDGLTGVWLDFETKIFPRKICAMGVKTSRWVTMHGLALNVNPDLSYFGNIVPCGISDKAVTSMKQELGKEIDMEQVKMILKKEIFTLFEMQNYE